MDWRVGPGGALKGTTRVPGDKSISHRGVLLGALAEGVTHLSGLLEGDDVLATIAAMRAMGVTIHGPDDGRLTVHGVGMRGLRAPAAPLDLGNSGTAMRLMAGLLSGQDFEATLVGDESLSRRPMGRVVDPLRSMGADIATAGAGTCPLRISPSTRLSGIDYAMPVASAQVKSALLLAGLYADGRTCVREPAPTRDHTERMLQAFGCAVGIDGATVCVDGGARLGGCDVEVPGDISSAAFLLVGACISECAELMLEHVGINPTRTGCIEILRAMGADIEILSERMSGGEPVADIRVCTSNLHGIEVPLELVPLAIDEFPVLFVAAACAEGRTVIRGASELRVKESDRIAASATALRALGVSVEELPDGLVINGGPLRGGEVDSVGDHRIAMAFAMAALRADAPIIVRDCANVATSFPGFAKRVNGLGLNLEAVG